MIKCHVNFTYYYLTLEIRNKMVHFYSKSYFPSDLESLNEGCFVFKILYNYKNYERKDLEYNQQGRKLTFLWDENTHDLLAQYYTFIISFHDVHLHVESTSCSKGTFSEYLRIMVMKSMCQEQVRWVAQTTIRLLAIVGVNSSEILVKP